MSKRTQREGGLDLDTTGEYLRLFQSGAGRIKESHLVCAGKILDVSMDKFWFINPNRKFCRKD